MNGYTKIEPSRKIPLTYLLYDATKAPTRFVQAVIRNAETRAVIETVNLTDNGNGDFSDYSKTPASISIAKGAFFEVITTVYKDAGFATPDSLRYQVTKSTYLVAEELGGAILGGREVGGSGGVNLDELVKKIFGYTKMLAHGERTFAHKFLGLIDTSEKTSKDISDLSEANSEMKESFEEVDNRIIEFAELVVKGINGIVKKIPDNDKDFNRVISQIINLNESFKILESHLGNIANTEFYEKVLATETKIDEIIDLLDKSDIINSIDDSNNKIIKSLSDSNKELLLGIKMEIHSFLQEIEIKIDELNEND